MNDEVMTEEELKQFDPEDLERLRNFRLLDDDYLTKFFEDEKECTELLLHILLERDDLRVTKVSTQHTIKNLQGRSVRLDIYAEDSTGKHYNIEIQRSDYGADARRARYNSSVLDANQTKPGDSHADLMDTYVIFITENDVIGDNLPIYHIERTVRENGRVFDDGSHILYVNASHTDESPLGLLMQDFACKIPKEMHYPLLAKRASELKEKRKGVAVMCKMMEDMRDKVREQTLREAGIVHATEMLKDGSLSIEQIARFSGLPVIEVKELEKTMKS